MKLGWPIWIGVVADDLERQRRFYDDVIGLREIERGEGWVWFDMDGRLFEIIQRDASRPQYERARYQVGFAVDDIHTAREELIGRGVRPIGDVEGGPESREYWCYFEDAEGNVFEIAQRIGSKEPS